VLKARAAAHPAALFIALLSLYSVILNLSGSLRLLELTHSPFLQTLALFIYNLTYTFTSFLTRKIAFEGKRAEAGLLASLATAFASFFFIAISRESPTIIAGLALLAASLAVLSPLSVGVLSAILKVESETSIKYNYYNSVGSAIGYFLAGVLAGIKWLDYIVFGIGVTLIIAGTSVKKFARSLEIPRVFAGPLPHHHSFSFIVSSLDKLLDLKQDLFYFKLFIRRLSISLKRRSYLTSLGIFFFFIGAGLFFTPLPSMMYVLGLSRREIFIEYGFFNVFSILGYQAVSQYRLTLEKMYDVLVAATLGRAVLFAIPGILLLEFASPNLWAVTGVMILVGFTWAFLGTTMMGILLSLAHGSEKTRAASTFNGISSLGTVIGSLIATLTVSSYGLHACFLLSGAFAALALYLFARSRSAILS